MVNLNIALLGKRPGLIYGVKRAKVPTKLRPNLLPQKQTTGRKYSSQVLSMRDRLAAHSLSIVATLLIFLA